jgi:hypothetical protein
LGLVWARARVTVEVRVRVSTIDHAAVRTRTAARGRQCVKLAPLRQAAAASDLWLGIGLGIGLGFGLRLGLGLGLGLRCPLPTMKPTLRIGLPTP